MTRKNHFLVEDHELGTEGGGGLPGRISLRTSTSTASETSVCNLWQWEIVDEYEEQFLTLIYCCIDQTEMDSTPDALEDAMEHKCAYK